MKLPAWTAHPLRTVLSSLCMALIMATTLTVTKNGFVSGWAFLSLKNAAMAFPVALTASFVIAPVISRIVSALTGVEDQLSRRLTDVRGDR